MNSENEEAGNEDFKTDGREVMDWEGMPPASKQEVTRVMNLISGLLANVQFTLQKPLEFALVFRLEEADGSITSMLLSSLENDEACELMLEYAAQNLPPDYFGNEAETEAIEEANQALHDLHSSIADKK